MKKHKYELRCKKCFHRKVCKYRDYYTNIDEQGLNEKCKHYRIDSDRKPTTKIHEIYVNTGKDNIKIDPIVYECSQCGIKTIEEFLCPSCQKTFARLSEDLNEDIKQVMSPYMFTPFTESAAKEIISSIENLYKSKGFDVKLKTDYSRGYLTVYPVGTNKQVRGKVAPFHK